MMPVLVAAVFAGALGASLYAIVVTVCEAPVVRDVLAVLWNERG